MTLPTTYRTRTHASLVGSLLLLLSLLIPTSVGAADEDDQATTLRDAVTKGTWTLAFRPRVELVEDDAERFSGRDAEAFTLRSSFKFTSASLHGFTLGLEIEDVAAIGNELYNNAGAGSRGNGVTNRPVVADPDLTEINQVWVGYDFGGKVAAKAGRLGRNLGDQRFVGTVGWRQNHQSLDALQLESNLGDADGPWKLAYLYVDQIHSVTGARHEIAGHLLDLRYEVGLGTFGLSSQWLDYDAAALFGRSLATTAINFTGSTKSDSLKWFYDVQIAQQDDAGDNPNAVSHGYFKLDGGVGGSLWSVRLGAESLEGDGVTAFQTPLATLHKFNGWADRFLTTPVDGLEDVYIKFSLKAGPWQGLLAFHEFTAESSSADYGSEIDAQVLWDAPWTQRFGFKLAEFTAEDYSVDVTKAMVWTSVSF